jgi:pyridoxal/pyridoxine/pyridoxamine kinase
MNLYAVYSGETQKRYYFALYDEDDRVVGTYYLRKDVPIPETTTLIMMTPNSEGWGDLVAAMIEKTREGSKAEQKLYEVLAKHKEVLITSMSEETDNE